MDFLDFHAPHFRSRFCFLTFLLLEMLELFEPLEPLEPLGLQTGLCLQDCPQMELEEVSDVAPAANEDVMVPLTSSRRRTANGTTR